MSANQHAETIVVRGDAASTGEDGEKMLVKGNQMAMRLWENEAAGTKKDEHTNPYEYVAYVLEGALRVTIDGHTAEVRKGDSYCVPAGSPYSLEVLEDSTVVEATSPSHRGEVTHAE